MAGYSGTPLPKKLGLKPGARLGLVRATDHFADTLGDLPDVQTLLLIAGGSRTTTANRFAPE